MRRNARANSIKLHFKRRQTANHLNVIRSTNKRLVYILHSLSFSPIHTSHTHTTQHDTLSHGGGNAWRSTTNTTDDDSINLIEQLSLNWWKFYYFQIFYFVTLRCTDVRARFSHLHFTCCNTQSGCYDSVSCFIQSDKNSIFKANF